MKPALWPAKKGYRRTNLTCAREPLHRHLCQVAALALTALRVIGSK
jgi:hypothetical protein